MAANLDPTEPPALQRNFHKIRPTRCFPLFSTLLALFIGGCGAAETETQSTAAEPAETGSCGVDGHLNASLFGAIGATLAWSGKSFRCESMVRPGREGVRLHLSGRIADEQLAIILALPDLVAGEAMPELASNVTITVEGSGRFFSTPDFDTCWTDVRAQTQLADDDNRYTIDATVYCVAPLGELNGTAAITIADMAFNGIVDWDGT